MQGQQVEPDMSPLTRHEFTTLATALMLQVNSLDSKFSRLNKTTIHDEKRMNEEILTTHRLINSNDEYSKSNIRELERKEKETERKIHKVEARVQQVLDVMHDNNTATNTRLTELEDKVALHALAEQLRKNHEQLKQTRKENAKEKNKCSTWNRMKKMVSKDGIENKYIVD